MAINASNTVDMRVAQELSTKVWGLTKDPKTFLRTLIGGAQGNVPTEWHTSTKFDYDNTSESNEVSSHTDRKSPPNVISAEGFQRGNATLPYINESFEITPEDLEVPPAGVDPFAWAKFSEVAKYRALATKFDLRMRKRIANSGELQVAEQLTTGAVTFNLVDNKGNTKDIKVNTNQPATGKVALTLDARWNQAASADNRLANVETWVETAITNGDNAPNTMVTSMENWQALRQDANFVALQGRRWDPLVSDKPTYMNGIEVSQVGTLTTEIGAVIKVYVYHASYKNPISGDLVRFVPAEYLSLFNDAGLGLTHHKGTIKNMKAIKADLAYADVYTYYAEDRYGKGEEKVYETSSLDLLQDARGLMSVKTY